VSANARKKMSQPKTIDDWLELSERQAFSLDSKGKKRVSLFNETFTDIIHNDVHA